MKVLCYVGEEKALKIWPDAELYQDNPPENDKYDGVYLENFLNQLPSHDVTPALKLFLDALKPGGKIVVAVPSLEWACREIVKSEPNPLAYIAIYGQRGEYSLSGFTLAWLRKGCEDVGFLTDTAYAQEIIANVNGQDLRATMNMYVGFKPDESASEAV